MLRALVSLSLLAVVAGPSHAAPPEGCIGFPDIPEAYVCITSFTPTNAVPGVTPGPGQTYSVPRFCVFECVGPTPVTVPGVTVTPGSGLVATIVYDGTTYPVYVPPAATVEQTVQQAQATVSNAVTTILGVATGAVQTAEGAAQTAGSAANGAVQTAQNTANGAVQTAQNTANGAVQTAQNTANGALQTAGNLAASAAQTVEDLTENPTAVVMAGEMRIASYGTGTTSGTLTATAVGAQSGGVTGYFSATFPPSQCPATGTASGTLSLNGTHWVSFTWTMVGGVAVMSTSNGGTGVGTFMITSHVGNPCGVYNVRATWNAVIAGL